VASGVQKIKKGVDRKIRNRKPLFLDSQQQISNNVDRGCSKLAKNSSKINNFRNQIFRQEKMFQQIEVKI